MSKATNIKNGNVNIKCEYCGGCGYHKLSCSTQKATVFLSDVKVEGVTAESEGVSGKHEGATKSGMSEIPTHQADRKVEMISGSSEIPNNHIN